MMRTIRTAGVPEQQPVSVRTKLATAWTSFMFLYIYVDYLHLYHPNAIKDIINGVVWELDITQVFVVGALTLVGIPILMVLASTTLPARACRLTTIVVASIYVPVSIFNVIGGGWVYFYGLGAALEVAILALIIRTAWTWPRERRDLSRRRSLAAGCTGHHEVERALMTAHGHLFPDGEEPLVEALDERHRSACADFLLTE